VKSFVISLKRLIGKNIGSKVKRQKSGFPIKSGMTEKMGMTGRGGNEVERLKEKIS